MSDDLYLREMDVWTLSRGYGNNFGSLRDAQSHLGLLDEFDDGFARLQGTWHQDLIQSQPFALQQLPDLWVDGRRELFGGPRVYGLRRRCCQLLASDGSERRASQHESSRDGSVATRRLRQWLRHRRVCGQHLRGLRARSERYSGGTDARRSVPTGTSRISSTTIFSNRVRSVTRGFNTRWIPFVQTGVSTELERVYDVNWKYIDKLKNTIEPFVNYNYVPDDLAERGAAV